MTKNDKIESLQGFRAIACLAVFFSHSWSDSWIGKWGGCGATAFFVLSGFLMFITNSERELDCSLKGCWHFLRKRLGKVYPLHIVMLAFSIMLNIIIWLAGKGSMSAVEFFVSIPLNALLLHTWIPNKNIYFSFNGVSWFLSVYAFCCFVFPIVHKRMNKAWSTFVSWGGIFISFLIPSMVGMLCSMNQAAYDYKEWLLYVNPIIRFMCFFCGIQLGYLYTQSDYKCSAERDSILEIIAILLLVGSTKIGMLSANLIIRGFLSTQMIYVPACMLMIVVLASGNGIMKKLLSAKALVYIGDISMYIFLIHQFVVQCVHMVWVNVIPLRLDGFTWTAASMALTLICVQLYIKIEKMALMRDKNAI